MYTSALTGFSSIFYRRNFTDFLLYFRLNLNHKSLNGLVGNSNRNCEKKNLSSVVCLIKCQIRVGFECSGQNFDFDVMCIQRTTNSNWHANANITHAKWNVRMCARWAAAGRQMATRTQSGVIRLCLRRLHCFTIQSCSCAVMFVCAVYKTPLEYILFVCEYTHAHNQEHSFAMQQPSYFRWLYKWSSSHRCIAVTHFAVGPWLLRYVDAQLFMHVEKYRL